MRSQQYATIGSAAPMTTMTIGAAAGSTTRIVAPQYAMPTSSYAGVAQPQFASTTYARPTAGVAQATIAPTTYASTTQATIAPTTYAPTTYAASPAVTTALPTQYVSGAVAGAQFGTTSIAAQPAVQFGSMSNFRVAGQPQIVTSAPQFVQQPQIVTSAPQFVQQPQVVTSAPFVRSNGTVAASYIGGMAVTQNSANLLASGTVVSERIISLEECYSSGLVRSEGGVVAAPQATTQIIEIVQPVNELVQDQFGQLEVVQVPEIVETVVVQQPAEFVQTALVAQPGFVETIVQEEPPLRTPVFVEGQGFVEQPVEAEVQQPGPPRVVLICTSCSAMGDQPTGAWSEEITAPYYVFQESGCEVYIASIEGGQVPIDEGSLAENFFTEYDRKFQEEGGMDLLANSIKISDVSPEAVDCVWLAGGHGTCMDFEANLAQFVTDAVAMGRPVGAVCHGVHGLLGAVAQDGNPLIAGRQVTGFSNAEEDAVGLTSVVPCLCQNRMQELGALYSCDSPWAEYAISDGLIVTGQNPQSSMKAAQLCVQAMMPPEMQQQEFVAA